MIKVFAQKCWDANALRVSHVPMLLFRVTIVFDSILIWISFVVGHYAAHVVTYSEEIKTFI